MNKTVLAALIIGGSIIIAAGLWIYFSPYQSCMRAKQEAWKGVTVYPGQLESQCR